MPHDENRSDGKAYDTPEPCQHTGLNRGAGGPNRRVITAAAVLMSCQCESEILPSGRKLHSHLDKAAESRLLSGNLSGSRLKDFSTYIIMSSPAGCKLASSSDTVSECNFC